MRERPLGRVRKILTAANNDAILRVLAHAISVVELELDPTGRAICWR